MYMRFVHLNVKPEAMNNLRPLYDQHVVPVLHATSGCLFAGLIQGVHHANECISMTLWDTPNHAEEYEHSGVFAKLLHDIQPYLADSSEWKIHLAQDLTVQYELVPEEPIVTAYTVSSQKPGDMLSSAPTGGLYVRIVSPQLREGKVEEFKRIYVKEMLPQLQSVKGCRYAAIIEHVSEPGKIISISIWDSKQDADDYEVSGLFDELTEKVKHTFSEIYQWKMNLQQETGKSVVTSAEMTVEGYSIIAGQSFL